VFTHPEHASNAGIVAILGGPALYLLGNALFKWATNDRRAPPLSHMAGLLLMLAGAVCFFAPALGVGARRSDNRHHAARRNMGGDRNTRQREADAVEVISKVLHPDSLLR
jgi:hypothetical protein